MKSTNRRGGSKQPSRGIKQPVTEKKPHRRSMTPASDSPPGDPGSSGRPGPPRLAGQRQAGHRQAEQALPIPALALSQIQDHIVVTNLEGSIFYVNEAVCRKLGRSPEELIGWPITVLGEDPAAGATQEEILRETLVHGAWRGEVVNLTADGRAVIFDCRTQTVRDEHGTAIALCGVSTDITERRRAEDALRQSEQQMSLILNAAAEMVAYYDTELRVIWANRAASESVGKSAADLVGQHCYEIWPQRSTPCPGCPVLKARDLKLPQQCEQQTPDGRWWSLRGYPVLDPEGEVIALVEFGQDITERKQAEAEKARLEEQVRQSQRLESIGRLAGGVAHDLNNLLSPILGYGEMLAEDLAGSSAHKEPAEEIVKAGRRARDLVGQLLAFGRCQAFEFRVLDLSSLVRDFEGLLRRTIREDINIRLRLDEALPPVKGDPGQLEQVLMNLAVNAQDAMPQGGDLTIETASAELDASYAASHRGVEPGSRVMLTISDTGCGMTPEIREHLFEPFFTTKKKDQGTGLGLATVYGIVKQHGGSVWAYSEPGRGAAFKIYLPVAEVSLPAGKPKASVATDLRGTETVLLAEDNEQVRDLIQLMLARQGYRVLSAGDGERALDLLLHHEGHVHLLLTDVIMPGMNGKELFKRASELRPDIKVLYMSGYTYDVIFRQGVIGEGVNFIQKPCSRDALAGKIREVLGVAA